MECPQEATAEAVALLRSNQFDPARFYRLIGQLPPEQGLPLMAAIPPEQALDFSKIGSNDPGSDYLLGWAWMLVSVLRYRLSPVELTQVIGVVVRIMRRSSSAYPSLSHPPEAQAQLDDSTVRKTCDVLTTEPAAFSEDRSRGYAVLMLAMADERSDLRALAEDGVERLQAPFLGDSRRTALSLWARALPVIALGSLAATLLLAVLGRVVTVAVAAAPPLSYLLLQHVQNGRIDAIRKQTHWMVLPRRFSFSLALASLAAMLVPMVVFGLVLGATGVLFAASLAAVTLFALAVEPPKLRRLVTTSIDAADFLPKPERIGGPPGV